MITNKDFLTANGNTLKTNDGRFLCLRGTNLGGWLVYEEWMGAVKGAPAGLDLIEKLEKRFGKDKADELLREYQANYITDLDFDNIAALGFNCIRLPFWYITIETDCDGIYDFSKLDYAVNECNKRNIYVILDFHGLPGFQSIAHHCGKINDCKLYDLTEEGEKYRKISVKMWEALAKHFNDNPVIAGYDLMNEPMCDFDEKQDDEAMWRVYDLLYRAVRKADKNHIIIMEAIWDFDHLPEPAQYKWKNVMYELHMYDPTDKDYHDIITQSESKMYCVPILVGEFHPSTENAHWEYILNLFNYNYINWTTWTYKGHSQDGNSDWFLYCKRNDENTVDIDSDSFDSIKLNWGNALKTDSFNVSNDLDLFKKYATQPLKNEHIAKLCADYQFELFKAKLNK